LGEISATIGRCAFAGFLLHSFTAGGAVSIGIIAFAGIFVDGLVGEALAAQEGNTLGRADAAVGRRLPLAEMGDGSVIGERCRIGHPVECAWAVTGGTAEVVIWVHDKGVGVDGVKEGIGVHVFVNVVCVWRIFDRAGFRR
jgi:hypothetical protein